MIYTGPEQRAHPPTLSKAELRELFEESAEKVIHNTFSLLGVDVTNQEQRNNLRDDFTFIRSWREGINDAGKTARKAAVTVGVTGLIAAAIAAFKMHSN